MKFICYILSLFSVPMFGSMRPIPWLVEDSIPYIESFLENNKKTKVLEFGSGASTVWFAERVFELHSVDHNKNWHDEVKEAIHKKKLSRGVNLYLLNRPYYNITDNFPDEYFDLILIDGRNRKGCFINAIRVLKKGGLLILDNSERPYYHSVFLLVSNWRTQTFTQIKPDSCGFFYNGWQTTIWMKP